MFDAADPSKIIGLFDWEMATVGDPLADLGVTLSYWIESGDPELLQKGFGKLLSLFSLGFIQGVMWLNSMPKRRAEM